MKIFKGTCELALSREDLEHALASWIETNTRAFKDDFEIASVTLHPGNKYVARITVQPSSKKTPKPKETQTDEAQSRFEKPEIASGICNNGVE